VKAEEKNFVLFKFVNEMSNDIEAIEAEVVELQEEVESGMSGPVTAVEEQRRKELKKKMEKKKQVEKKAREVEKVYNKSENQLHMVRKTNHSIFKTLDCDLNSDLLGNQGVTEGNMMTYLGMVEQRLNEVVQVYHLVQQRNK
jgi:hypothetical protein